jgi:hypothetical protein
LATITPVSQRHWKINHNSPQDHQGLGNTISSLSTPWKINDNSPQERQGQSLPFATTIFESDIFQTFLWADEPSLAHKTVFRISDFSTPWNISYTSGQDHQGHWLAFATTTFYSNAMELQ